jgi:hypothetical protein
MYFSIKIFVMALLIYKLKSIKLMIKAVKVVLIKSQQ